MDDIAAALRVAVLLGMLYFLWLHWFMAHRGLAIGVGRAVLTVMALAAGTVLVNLAAVPLLRQVMPGLR